MTKAEIFAPAKVNLTLHVTGQRADGYHLLDSLVVFADFGDRMWVQDAPDMRIDVRGPFAEGVPLDHRNLVWRAAELAGWHGQVQIEKNLPHGAGIGGGSSDAAALLNWLDHQGDGASLGADVPVCRIGKAVRMRGIGDVLSDVPTLPRLHAVLVNPGVHVPTPQVFGGLEHKTNPGMEDMWDNPAGFLAWLKHQRNDLEAPAVQIAPQISDVLAVLSDQPACTLARMSGSGSTCFGLFSDAGAAQSAEETIQSKRPDWWVKSCRLG